MDINPKVIENDINHNLIRHGSVFKRSSFLKQWKPKYIFLTSKFFYIAEDEKMKGFKPPIPLKAIKSYKSYVRRDDEMIPPAMKLYTSDAQYYFCFANCYEKWSWMVTFERVLDFKYMGPSSYNDEEGIKQMGFKSQNQFEKGKVKVEFYPHKKKVVKTSEQKEWEKEKLKDEKIKESLEVYREHEQELENKKIELDKKQALLKENESRQNDEKLRFIANLDFQPIQQMRNSIAYDRQSKVAELRNIYESRASLNNQFFSPETMSKEKQIIIKSQTVNYRSRLINLLFEELKMDSSYSSAFKYIVNFLANVGGDDQTGFSSYVIIEGKSHPNRFSFAQIFTNQIKNWKQEQKCLNFMKFIQVCIFQIPGLFNNTQTKIIHDQLKQFLLKNKDQEDLERIIKNMIVLHKVEKYDKKQISQLLNNLTSSAKRQQTRIAAHKFYNLL